MLTKLSRYSSELVGILTVMAGCLAFYFGVLAIRRRGTYDNKSDWISRDKEGSLFWLEVGAMFAVGVVMVFYGIASFHGNHR